MARNKKGSESASDGAVQSPDITTPDRVNDTLIFPLGLFSIIFGGLGAIIIIIYLLESRCDPTKESFRY